MRSGCRIPARRRTPAVDFEPGHPRYSAQEQNEGRLFEGCLDDVRAAPADDGPVELIVRRPASGPREIPDEVRHDVDGRLTGDRWALRDVDRTPAWLAAQLAVMSTRVLAAIDADRSRWLLAGDQLYVGMDPSVEDLPAGTRLTVGSAILEVSETPYTGCTRVGARFRGDALQWVNSPDGRAARLRGLNARIVQSGTVRVGGTVARS